MKDIIDEYSPILEGVEPEDIKKEVKKKVKESRLQTLKNLINLSNRLNYCCWY